MTSFPNVLRAHRKTRLVLSVLLLAAGILTACAAPDYEAIFRESLAQEALTCMHPRGVFEAATDFREEGDGVYGGTIHWKGATLENEHTTRVRFKVEDGVAKVYLVEDSAFLPAARQSCEIPLATGS